jgi:hypothetical protein
MPIKPFFSLTGILTGEQPGTGKPPGKYVYQKTKKGLGNIPGDTTRRHQVRIWTAGTNPNTPSQQIYRNKFAAGVAAWHALTGSEKEALRVPAEKLHLNNFQLFMRQWMRADHVALGSQWNGGTVTWNNGTGIWNL